MARPNSGEEWHYRLGEAFEKASGLFLTLHNAPPGSIEAVDSEPRTHSACLVHVPFSFSSLAQMVRIIRVNQIDIIAWNFAPSLTNPYVWALSVTCPRVRHWLFDHVSQPMPLPSPPGALVILIKSLLLKRYARVVCVSDFVAAHLAKRGYSNITTNYMFVDPDRFQANPEVRERMRRELKLDGRFAILLTGYMIREKGGIVALNALRQLGPDVVLIVLGDGPHLPELEATADGLGVKDQMRFVGFHSDVVGYMQAADIAVCPSLWAEAVGVVNMEAQASGLPVVASRVGGIPEIIEDGVSGLLYELGNAQELAACISVLKNHVKLCWRMGQAGRNRVIEKFSFTARIPIYLEMFSHAR